MIEIDRVDINVRNKHAIEWNYGEMKTVDEENVSSRNSSQFIELHKKVLRQWYGDLPT